MKLTQITISETKPVFKNNQKTPSPSQKSSEQNNIMKLGLALTGLAVLGASTVFYVKTKPITFEKALEKAGVQIKDGIATVKETGELFTGKIQRFAKHTSKETTEYVNGKISERVYHSLKGKEQGGDFYKDGDLRLTIGFIGRSRFYGAGEFKNGKNTALGEGRLEEGRSLFEHARECVKNME